MDIISDIYPNTFKFLEVDNMDLEALKNLGFKTIRIDEGRDAIRASKSRIIL